MKDQLLQVMPSTANTTRESFPVTGMTCAGCAVSVESTLQASMGVAEAGVNFATQTAWVVYDKKRTGPKEFKKALQSVGYDLIIDAEDPAQEQEVQQLKHYQHIKRSTVWSLILAFPVFIIGMFLMHMPFASWISMCLTLPVLLWCGRSFFTGAWKQAKHGKANMDTLVALSTGIAFLFSVFNTVYPEFWQERGMHAHVYYEAAAVIIAFISLGKLLEANARSKTSSAIKQLMGLQPLHVTIVTAKGEKEIPTASLEPGNIVIVRPGERIPVDGTITTGSSFIDQSAITGEPLPVERSKDMKVFAGTMNQKGSFQFRAEQVGSDTILAHIIKMVREAQGSKAPVQKLVDKIAGIFVPVVIGIAILTFIIWMIAGGENAFTHALLTSVSVLVIACPCALGLATPTAIMVGIGRGAAGNILIKDAESLELAHKVNTVVLDKTGTLTEGRPVVANMYWLPSVTNKEFLSQVLYHLELQSEHPLASAITQALASYTGSNMIPDQFESITAKGVKGRFQDCLYYAGNKKLLTENQISIDPELLSHAAQWQEQARTVIFFSNEQQALAIMAITDPIKKTSAQAVQQLKSMGIEVCMLTGDNQQTAAAVAAELGITNYKAEVLPTEKSWFIKSQQTQQKVVAMVGDGINDSQALAQADVSIAMGKGSDIAMEVAAMTLITSDLSAIPRALTLSKKTVQTIRQNLFWAFIYNVIGIPLAAGILYPVNGFLLDPMIAGAAMALSSVSVVSNSLRLKTRKI